MPATAANASLEQPCNSLYVLEMVLKYTCNRKQHIQTAQIHEKKKYPD